MVDHGVGGGSDRRLGAERHADPGFAQHGEIVRAVADRHGGLTAKAETVAQRDQGQALRLAPEDRLLDAAGERLVCDDEPVGAVLVEADHLGDRAGEKREAARDEAGVGAVRPHRAHERARAGRQRDARGDDLIDDRERQPLEQRHPLPQRRLERDLAAHGALRDRRDLRFEADIVGELVDAFLRDHGRVHVGEEQALAPLPRRLRNDVDRRSGERRAQRRDAPAFVVEEEVGRDLAVQAMRRVAAGKRAAGLAQHGIGDGGRARV